MKKIFTIFTIMLFASTAWASKASDVKAGNKFYNAGSYKESLDKYNSASQKDPNSEIINFNLGTASYKNKEYDNALNYFRKALLGDDLKLKEKSYFNLGNTLYKTGISKENSKIDDAIENLKEALGEYEKALLYKSGDEDLKYNYDFVKKEIERLLKKQQEQQQNKEQQQNQEQQKQNEQNQQNQEQKQQQQKQEQNQQPQAQDEKQEEQQEKPPEPNEQQEKKDEEKQQSTQENQEAKESEGQEKESTGQAKENDMSKQEAKMLLKQYQDNEEPKELLNFMNHNIKVKDVEKNW